MHQTSRLQIDTRSLSDEERRKCQQTIDFCQRKIDESPAPKTFIGRLFDLFTDAKQFRAIRLSTIEFNKAVLEAARVQVLRCTPLAVVQIDPYEDEGTHYFFDVGENILLFLGGQDFDPTRAFPNSEFEIVRQIGGPLIGLYGRGQKLRPVRKIPGSVAKSLPVYAGACFTFPGKLISAETDYQTYSQQVGPAVEDWWYP